VPVTGSNLPILNLDANLRSATFKFANFTNKFKGIRNTYSNYGYANLRAPSAGVGSGHVVINLPANHAIGNSLAFGTPAISGLLVDGAYAPVGEGLKTGHFNAVPEPSPVALGGLGLLALGAAGVREMRRCRLTSVE